jgi:hypothetical protein
MNVCVIKFTVYRFTAGRIQMPAGYVAGQAMSCGEDKNKGINGIRTLVIQLVATHFHLLRYKQET